MIERVKNNLKYIRSRFTLLASMVFGSVSILQIFVDWKTFGIEEADLKCKIIVFCALLFVCGISSIIWGAFLSKKITVFSEDEVKIVVKYDDLMNIAFPKKQKEERIVVIAVNCCFDTEISQDLIREQTVHGQFLKRFATNEFERQSLDSAIDASMIEFEVQAEQLERSEKRYGKLKRYPLGSVARINGRNGVTFFLLALTEFDRDCKAHCNKHQYVECILKLFEYYDSHGQGMDMYLYPMGTSMARTGLTRKEALESVVTLTKISKEHLKSKTTIVVDKKNKNEIAITDI